VLYSLSIFTLGQPLVWTFDPDGSRGVFAGLVLAAFALLVPTGIYLILPRRWGMSLFALEAILIWVANVWEFSPSRVFTGFILWSILELPMYGFEILGLLESPTAPVLSPRRPGVPAFLLLWLILLAGAYIICYTYEYVGSAPQYPKAMWAVAIGLLPIPPIVAARSLVRRAFRPSKLTSHVPSAAG